MARKQSEEAAFLRGEVGVDGQATEEEKDPAQVEQEGAKEQLLRGGTWLGREFLTWLLWRSESGEPLLQHEGEPVTVLFTGRLALRGLGGEVVELVAKGAMAPYSEIVRHALERGLLVHSARIRVSQGERTWELTLDAEHLDVRSAKLPELLTEADDDRQAERLHLTEQLSALLDALCADFVSIRIGGGWNKKVVPELRAWMAGQNGGSALATARRVAGR